jgi:hypothetical protein
VPERPGALVGLFPTRGAAETAFRARYALRPPSRKAVWLLGGRTPRIAKVSATGKLDCIFQLPGMGDNRGTFAWLTVQKVIRAHALA